CWEQAQNLLSLKPTFDKAGYKLVVVSIGLAIQGPRSLPGRAEAVQVHIPSLPGCHHPAGTLLSVPTLPTLKCSRPAALPSRPASPAASEPASTGLPGWPGQCRTKSASSSGVRARLYV
ncbi:hypothetical protein HaLaN_09565, partial [Haematococcus lacustris]